MNGNFKTLIAIAATPLLLVSCSDEVKLTTEGEGENLVSLTVQFARRIRHTRIRRSFENQVSEICRVSTRRTTASGNV